MIKWFLDLKLTYKIYIVSLLNAFIIFSIWSLLNGRLNVISEVWEHYQEFTINRTKYLSRFKSAFGYGGITHHFQQYLITGDEEDAEQVKKKVKIVKTLVEKYKVLPKISQEEFMSLTNLEKIAAEYENFISLIKEKKASGETIENIYSEISIDKASVLSSFNDLEYRMVQIVNQNSRSLTSIINDISIFLFFFFVVLLLIITAINIYVSKTITKPIIKAVSFANEVAKGNLTAHVDIQSKDETGQLASALIYMRDNLTSIIRGVNNVTSSLTNNSTEINHSVFTLTNVATGQRNSVDNVRDKILNLDEMVHLSKKSADEVNEFITEVAKLITTQAATISESSASIREMSHFIGDIARASEDEIRAAKKLEESAKSGEEEMQEMLDVVDKVTSSTHVILEIAKVIDGIAEQTNILAMNAAIEAAHAGKTGKGFAIVANQVRKLADDTSKNSKQISKSLRDITSYIHIAAQTADKTHQIFKEIVTRIRDASFIMVKMKESTSELDLRSSNMIDALFPLIEITDDVKTSSVDMKDKINDITNSMNNLSSISSDAKLGMHDIKTGVNTLTNTVRYVSMAGTRNAESVHELEGLIKQFTVEGYLSFYEPNLHLSWDEKKFKWVKKSDLEKEKLADIQIEAKGGSKEDTKELDIVEEK